MKIGSVSNISFNNLYTKKQQTDKEKSDENNTIEEPKTNTLKEQISAEEKIRKADEFCMKHDALYAEQMTDVMKYIRDGMEVAQEIARRMSSGAKVSPADEQNLMLYDPRMYAAAKNAQIIAQNKEDKSDEVLIDEFVEHHAHDRNDWTTELNETIETISDVEVDESGKIYHKKTL